MFDVVDRRGQGRRPQCRQAHFDPVGDGQLVRHALAREPRATLVVLLVVVLALLDLGAAGLTSCRVMDTAVVCLARMVTPAVGR